MGSKKFKRLIGDFHSFFSESPCMRIALGMCSKIEDYSEPTLGQQRYDVKRAKKLLSRMRGCSRRSLDFNENLDLDLAILILRDDIFQSTFKFNGKTFIQQTPFGGADVSESIYTLYFDNLRPANRRLDVIVARMENASEYLESHLNTLDEPVERWVELDLKTVRKIPELFDAVCELAEKENYGRMGRLIKAKNKLLNDFRNYYHQLKAMPTTRNFVIGEDQARRLVRLIGIDYSFEEMHAMARRFLEETAEELQSLRPKLVEKYGLPKNTTNQQLHGFLNRHYALPLEKILDYYHCEYERAVEFLERLDLFEFPDNQDVRIIQTPKFLEHVIPVAAMDSPMPFRRGMKRSTVYVTIKPALIGEHTKIKIPSLVIHEAVPGHHLQFASAYCNPSIVRKHIFAGEHAEGWTTMLEDYALDKGHMGDLTDEARFIGRLDINRLGARIGIDLYFMTGQKDYLNVGANIDTSSSDPFVNAGRLLKRVTGFASERVKTELDWYSLAPGYPLSYLVGNKMAWQLKQDFTEAQQGRLEGDELDKLFHKIYLESGCMPVKYLRRVFEHKGLLENKK